jgi:hypothetical protein
MRAFGTHHCGKCKRCVYRMDHHCPWTDNCVGYLTIKPFILFLFYTQLLMLWELSMAYKIAWDRNLSYISPIQMAKQTSFHPAIMMSSHTKELRDKMGEGLKNKLTENGLQHGMLWNLLHSESIFSSWNAFLDSIGFYGTYALLCYTIGICSMVLYLVYI